MKNVFAHYFLWFSRKDTSGRWEHWNWDGPGTCHNPDNIIDGFEDVAAVDIPLAGAYDSSDARVQRYHLDLAEAAGIDAFCVDWYGTSGTREKNRDHIVDKNFNVMLKIAGNHKTKICICYEEKILFDEKSEERVIKTARSHMRHIAENYFTSPGYWYSEGRPVLIVWGNNKLSTAVWKEILKEMEGYNPWVIYSHHDHNPDYVKFSHGFYPWVLLGDLDFQRSYLDEYYTLIKSYMEEGKTTAFGGGVWPGFNDTGVFGWGEGTRIIPDGDDRLYDITWEYVLKNNPGWVSITTWNDWNEGSNIEPGVKRGPKYLKMTADYIARYKGIKSGVDINAVLAANKLQVKK